MTSPARRPAHRRERPAPRLPRPRTHRRGGTGGVALCWHLVALLVVPVLAVVAFGGALVDWRVGDEDRARQAQQAITASAQLDTVRGAIQREALPSLLTSVLAAGTGAAALGLTPERARDLLAGQKTLLAAARRSTDAAVLGATSAGARERVAPASSQLLALREETDAATISPSASAMAFLSLATSLAQGEREQATAATTEGLDAASATASHDLTVMALLSQYAGSELPLLLAAHLAGVVDDQARSSYLIAWGTWEGNQDRVQELSSAQLRTTWYRITASAGARALEATFSAEAASAAPVTTLATAEHLAALSATRDAAVHGMVAAAASAAQASATAARERARRMVLVTLAGVLLAIAGAASGVVLVSRTTAGSLSALARTAHRIRSGHLDAVAERGPSEVRTVARALGNAVDNLRRVQEQAEAVATGDLASPALSEPLPGPLGAVLHASLQRVVAAVTSRDRMQEVLAHSAAHDALTGLANRAASLELIDAALARAARTGSCTGVMFVDLDRFKPVNDTLGHAAGDEVLRTVATRLSECVRAGDAVGRLGGDEFVVLVEHVEDERALLGLAERIVAAISAPVPIGARSAEVSASVGLTLAADGPTTDATALLHEADVAVYRAKSAGRGRVEVFDDALRAELEAHADTERGLREALREGGLHLAYQPVWDVATGRVAGFEALCRWDRPGVGPVRPDLFIPVAEASDLVCDLGRWALAEATRTLARWTAAPGAGHLTIGVNISGRHVADPRVLADVADALALSGLRPEQLVLEITETVLLDSVAAGEHLRALRELGCAVAIDDFGTGYTAIGQITGMPADILKIDRSFVISSAPGDAEVLALAVAAAHSVGLLVIAEGVETEEQSARIARAGCDQVQGYLHSRPLPPAQAEALLTTEVPGADQGKSIHASTERQVKSGTTTDRGLV